MWSFKFLKFLALVINLIFLFDLICFSNGNSIKARVNNKMNDLYSILAQSNSSSIFKELNKNKESDQKDQDKIAFLNFNNQVVDLSPSSSNNDPRISSISSESSDEVMNILRNSLAKLPGESMGKLIDKRNAYLNISSIEQLLDLETNAVEISKDVEPGCYIEIRIIKRIPGRCSIVDGEAVCKADNYYKKNDECSKQ